MFVDHFYRIIFNLGVFSRNKKIFEQYKFLKETESWSQDKLQYLKLQRFKDLASYAYSNSPYYRTLWNKIGFSPENITSLGDIKKLPILSKQDLILNSCSIQNTEGFKKLFLSETSGTSGEPLKIFRDDIWDAAHRASIYRGYSWYGINPWVRNGYLWGYNNGKVPKIKTVFLDKLQNRFRLFSYDSEEITKFIKKLKKSKYLEGYSSMIYEIAKDMNNKSQSINNLVMIKGTSETIHDYYQPEIRKAFGKKMISEYGSMESGIIAFECPSGGLHVVEENVILEVFDGEVVVTNLLSKSFPIIRYRLGDSISLDSDRVCECGMKHSLIKEIHGRTGKLIYGKHGQYPSLTLYYIFKNLILSGMPAIGYQVVQKEKGKLVFYFDRKFNASERASINKECLKYFSDDVKCEFSEELLKRDYSKKFESFVTLLEF